MGSPATVTSNRQPPPKLPGGLPYLGHAHEFYRDPVALVRRGRERFGDIFSFLLTGKLVTVFMGPKAQAAFFKAPENLLSAKEAYRFMTPIFGRGIAYDATPEIMQEQLGFFFPALREERLQAYARFMEEETEGFLARWNEEGEIDLLEAANELTVFIASRCLIGKEFRQNMSGEFARLYHDMEGGINLLAFLRPHLPLPSFWRRDRARRRMGELIARIVAERRSRKTDCEDFLDALMTAQYSDGRALSGEEITGLLLTMIFAGQHTSAVLAAWTGLLLLQHPQFLPPIREELEQVFESEKAMTLQSLRRLVALERAVKEAERMYPPLVMLMRKVLRDFEHGGYHIPAGGIALVSPAAAHRLPEVFRNPDNYDPGRFAPGREEDRQDTFAMIAFGGGRHRCIGSTFAYQQVKVIWSILLRRYDLELVQPCPQPDYSTFVVGPHRPCVVRYRRKRWPNSVTPIRPAEVAARDCLA